MKTILVYGDSNTWGQTATDTRYDYDVRWTTILEALLGADYRIYSAGVSGRIAGSYDNVPEVKRGKDSFEVVYRQVFPIDMVIIALGTNDIKAKYAITSENIANDLLWYARQLEAMTDYTGASLSPRVMYMLPPNFDKGLFEGDDEKRRSVNEQMQQTRYDTVLLDDVQMSADGVHFSKEGHRLVAEAVYDKLQEMSL